MAAPLRTDRPPVRTWPRWSKILALVLLPAVVAGVLLAGLGRPADRLDTVPAAIVNRDQPVKVDGRLAPLGRQLAQAIAHPSAAQAATYDWVVTNLDDAEAGLAGGAYAAVVVIPRSFSRAATSLASDEPRQAVIDVRTSDRSGLADGIITQNLTGAAQQAFGADLTARYLQNLFVGFGDLRTGLGEIATGADRLTDGTGQLAQGVVRLSDGLGGLAGGAQSLAAGTGSLADGAGRMHRGVAQTADGAAELATGSERLAGGVAELADGVQQVADATRTAGTAAARADAGTRDLVTALARLADAQEVCRTDPADCAEALQLALSQLPDEEALTALVTASATSNAYLNGIPGEPGLVAGTADLASGADRLTSGATRAADGTAQLAKGLQRLSQGTGELADGASQLAQGADQLATGAAQAAAGADPLTAGAQSLVSGTGELAAGLHQVADQVPRYSQEQRSARSHVAAVPVVSEPVADSGLTWLGAALLVTLTLWVGATLTWLLLPPVAAGAYESSRSTAWLSWRAARPGLVAGAVQGLLVGTVVAASLDAPTGARVAFVLIAVLAGSAFTAVLQGVMGLFGLLGGVVAVAWAAVALAAGLVSTAPSWFAVALTQLPFGPLVTGLRQVAAGALGVPWSAVVALVVTGLAGYLLTMAATRRRRSARRVAT